MPETINTLRRVPLFRGLDDDALARLAQGADRKAYAAGDYLFHEGAPRTELFVIAKGDVEIVVSPGNEEVVVAHLGEGSFVGEGAMLDDEPHHTSCRAVVETSALILGCDALDEIFQSDPKTARTILSEIARTITRRLRAASLGHRADVVLLYAGGAKRREHDLLGELDVPNEAYFGIQTLRAVYNFRITGIPLGHFPNLIKALAMVKKAAAIANRRLDNLEPELADAICAACDEIIRGNLHNHFVVDMIQGGAGTSTNMNANEVICNRALELLGHNKGDYHVLHPNNHVNFSQSTNDVYPTAIRLAILLSYEELTSAMEQLCERLAEKGAEFATVIKMGRTQLQDAVPITLGQEFGGFHTTVREDIDRTRELVRLFREVNLGATAIGTGINTDPRYAGFAVEELSRISGIEFLSAADLVEATSDMGAFVIFSGVLKRIAVKISKVCNDLRLLSSGPRAGFNEINLPAVQPGSSIMPGKVNPVIPEVVNQVAFQVIGNDLTVTMAAEAGQLQLNVMEPVIAFNILRSMRFMTQAMQVLAERCISGITANEERCRWLVEHSIGVITAVNPFIGYENSTRIAKKALETGRGVMELILEEGLLDESQLEDILKPENMTRPRSLKRP
jgi:aspartate ammonia-lyase